MEACLVTDRRLASGEFLPRLLRQATEAGVDRIQVREKDLGGRALTLLVREALRAARGTRATVFVNDRLDVALAAPAHGVHLDPEGIPPDLARRIAGDDLVVGSSVHSLEEALEAQERGADYLLFGPVFPGTSCSAFRPPAGPAMLEALLRRAGIPVYAAGGIGPDNLERLQDLPLAGVAMTSAFVRAASVPDLVRRVHGQHWR